MQNDNELRMAEYKASNFNRRLDMYLQFPVLRPGFLEIDRGEMETKPGDYFNDQAPLREYPGGVGLSFGNRVLHFIASGLLGRQTPGEKCRDFC